MTHNFDWAGLKIYILVNLIVQLIKPWRKVGEGFAAYHWTAWCETPRALMPLQFTGPVWQGKQSIVKGIAYISYISKCYITKCKMSNGTHCTANGIHPFTETNNN